MRACCPFKPLLLLALAMTPLAARAESPCERLTATGNPEYPPYLWRDPQNPQQLIGANADLLKRLASELGMEITVQYTGPWSRAQEEVRKGSIDMVAGFFKTSKREESFDYIFPAFLETPSVVWARKGDGFPYTGWDDLRGHVGGSLVNNSYGQQFDDYAKTNLKLEPVPSARQAFEKLLFKRNDYVIFERYPGLALARIQGIDSRLQILGTVSSEGLYLAMSHKSACNTAALRERLTQKMNELVTSAVPQQLLEQNLQRWEHEHGADSPRH